ncbi:hypothetical protein [Granulicella arctica]|uniref:Uncharacterized protein n=1 Tax=Granulicella arctica TaxID=940613 RepID=A0A7Y9TKG1_9BACT|nr:hypothetical protein [Granulicella arctica]NYF79212.1 hypothetical protein [Granulicella arctica]
MRSIMAVFLFLMCSLPALAVEGNQAAYLSGTTAAVKLGALGTLDTTSPTDLIFVSPQGNLNIPYLAIDRLDYHNDLAHHIGVAPALAVGIVRRREKRHFFDITYHDQAGVAQVAVFEVAKGVPPLMLPILRARATNACGLSYAACSAKTR